MLISLTLFYVLISLMLSWPCALHCESYNKNTNMCTAAHSNAWRPPQIPRTHHPSCIPADITIAAAAPPVAPALSSPSPPHPPRSPPLPALAPPPPPPMPHLQESVPNAEHKTHCPDRDGRGLSPVDGKGEEEAPVGVVCQKAQRQRCP